MFLHIVAALFWVGGMLFLTLVVAPFLMKMEDPKARSAVYQEVGSRFRFWGWVAITMLLVTGPINLYYMGVPPSKLMDPALYSTGYGKALMAKLAFVTIIVISSLLHDFWLGPGARNSRTYSTIAKVMGRSNLVTALIIIVLAVVLRNGGF